jgi:hypothetical protein
VGWFSFIFVRNKLRPQSIELALDFDIFSAFWIITASVSGNIGLSHIYVHGLAAHRAFGPI